MNQDRSKVRFRSELFDDAPATGDDVKFGYQGMAESLADYALNPGNNTPFTIVLRGPWGRGKTTLLKATREVLDSTRDANSRKPYTLEFNVWKYPDEDTILAGLLGALLDAMRTGNLPDQIKLFAEDHKNGLAKKLIGIAAPWVDLDTISDSKFSVIDEKRAFHDTFRTLFGQLWLLWQDGSAVVKDLDHRDVGKELEQRQQTRVLAIFLDDLDRCNEDRLLQTLQAINLFLDLPGVCFYLGVDWGRVVDVLQKSDLHERAELFLEKIVQVAFDLPEVSDREAADYTRQLVQGRELGRLLEQPLVDDALVSADSEVTTPASPLPIETLGEVLEFNQPRHVKRVLNDLSIRLASLDRIGKLQTGTLQVEKDGLGNAPSGEIEAVSVEGVIALHLLRQACSPDQLATLNRFEGIEWLLEAWRARLAKPVNAGVGNSSDDGEDGEPSSSLQSLDFWADLVERVILHPSLVCLEYLSGTQRELLVHHSALVSRDRNQRRRYKQSTASTDTASDFVWLEGGTFIMGEEGVSEPVHTVTVSGFHIARHAVTNEAYARFVESVDYPQPSHWTDDGPNTESLKHPVVNVSWNDAVAYCRWLSEELNGTMALPTEAQWEFAARGTAGRMYSWGTEKPDATRANFENPAGSTSPIGTYPAGRTPEGLEDMAGNVWEWCADWYADYSVSDKVDPVGPSKGESRVLRGGSFVNPPSYLRAADRNLNAPQFRLDHVGFRVVWLSPENN